MRNDSSGESSGFWNGAPLGLAQVCEDTLGLAWRMRDAAATIVLTLFVFELCIDVVIPLATGASLDPGTVHTLRPTAPKGAAQSFESGVLPIVASYCINYLVALLIPRFYDAYRNEASPDFLPAPMLGRYLRSVAASFIIALLCVVFCCIVGAALGLLALLIFYALKVPVSAIGWVFVFFPLAVTAAALLCALMPLSDLVSVGILAQNMRIRQALTYAWRTAFAPERIRRTFSLGAIALLTWLALEAIAGTADRLVTSALHVRNLNLITDLVRAFAVAPLASAFAVVLFVDYAARASLEHTDTESVTLQSSQT